MNLNLGGRTSCKPCRLKVPPKEASKPCGELEMLAFPVLRSERAGCAQQGCFTPNRNSVTAPSSNLSSYCPSCLRKVIPGLPAVRINGIPARRKQAFVQLLLLLLSLYNLLHRYCSTSALVSGCQKLCRSGLYCIFCLETAVFPLLLYFAAQCMSKCS